MAKIIKVNTETLLIGDGEEVIEINRESIDFYPRVGDEVDVFKRGDECFAYPKDVNKDSDKDMNKSEPVNIHIQNNNTSSNVNTNNINSQGLVGVKPKNKWIALALCGFLGFFGAHKFYEGKIMLGVLYLFTVGLFGIGVIYDFIKLLFKPNPYYPS